MTAGFNDTAWSKSCLINLIDTNARLNGQQFFFTAWSIISWFVDFNVAQWFLKSTSPHVQ